MNYHILSVDETSRLLGSGEEGLPFSNAEERLLEFGSNELIERKKKPVWVLFLHQFREIMILILIGAAIVSLAIGDAKDAVVIFIIIFLNALIGFIQEYNAEKAMAALKKLSALQALVRRGNKLQMIPAAELVPGDRVVLESGNIVPADLRLTETHALKIEESSLTGESNAVDKSNIQLDIEDIPIGDRTNMAFKSTRVTYGRGEGIVVATGMDTEVGRIAQLLQEEEVRTPLQLKLAHFSKKLSFVVAAICIAIYLTGIIRGENPLQMLLTAISVAVAAIPEALPAIITISLAIGAKRMVRKKALIRKLPSVETLGSITFICSDKTGTITQNNMTLTDIWEPNTQNMFETRYPQFFLRCLEWNHDVKSSGEDLLTGDPTETAIVSFVRKHSLYQDNWQQNIRVAEIPFDSFRKRMSIIRKLDQQQYVIITKGAVESILTCCNSHPDHASILTQTESFASQGKRVLGYAAKVIREYPTAFDLGNLETGMEFIGLTALIDPPRPEAAQAIEDCYTAGITPVMITGDHPVTAKAIALETGILRRESDKLITGTELNQMNEEDFEAEVERIKVYARVSPEQKLHIVRTLQKKNHFVAMTGDGVNDAPALHRANMGIAMGITGTDVSKESAQMILLDDNFATIIQAVKEGRRIYDNIRKFIKYTLTSNGGEIWTIFLAPLLALPISLLPIHILWINLVTDGLPGLAFAAEPAEDNILKRPPRKTNESIFAEGTGIHILWVGVLMGIVCVLTQAWAIHIQHPKWQTMVFTVLCLSQMGHAMAIRSHWKSLFSIGVFSNKPLIGAVLLTLLLQLMITYIPFLQPIFRTQALTFRELMICIGLSSVVFWAVEAEKLIKRKMTRLI